MLHAAVTDTVMPTELSSGPNEPCPPAPTAPGALRRRWAVAAVATTVLLGLTITLATPDAMGVPLWRYLECQSPPGPLWSDGGECVGISDGAHSFGPDVAAVQELIAERNARAVASGDFVSIAVLLPLATGPATDARAVQELEGMYIAQVASSPVGPDGRPPVGAGPAIRLLIAQVGSREQAWAGVVRTVEARAAQGGPDHLVAVVGLGPSTPRSLAAARHLGDHGIPVIADLTTAEGFDASGSIDDGGPVRRFMRISAAVGLQYATLHAHLAAILPGPFDPERSLVIRPPAPDPFTGAAIQTLTTEFGIAARPQWAWSASERATWFSANTAELCRRRYTTVFYAAAPDDLAVFLEGLAAATGRCAADLHITVLTTDGAARLRIPASALRPDAAAQLHRTAVALSNPRISLFYTPVADPAILADRPQFEQFRQQFTAAGFDVDDLDTGSAITGHDAVIVAATAAAMTRRSDRRARSAPGPAAEDAALRRLLAPDHTLLAAAQGPISLDTAGSRLEPPAVVQLRCSAEGSCMTLGVTP